MGKTVEVKRFAERVERLCDFLLDRMEERDGSSDLRVIQDLKEDAANIQTDNTNMTSETISGLHDFMKGGS